MGTCIDKIPHEECGSRRGLQVFGRDDDDVDGFCFGCRSYVRHPYGDEKPEGIREAFKAKTEEEIQEEIGEISDYGVCTLHDRRLNADSLAHFGIKVGVSQADGMTPDSHHYPYHKDGELVAYKNRIIKTKAMWTVGGMKDVDLFGWDKAIVTGQKRLYITEGECDAVALYQMIRKQQDGTQYADRIPAVVSLTKGAANAANDITRNLERIGRMFDEVVLVFDEDEAGYRAADEVLKIAPDFMTVDLPEKDANECLLAGKTKACVDAVMWKAAVPKNTNLVWGSDLHEAGRTEAQWGASYPWPKLTAMTRGMRFGETVYFGAGVKMGKSEVVNALIAHCITEHGWKVFAAKPEEANRKTYQMVVGKVMGRVFHDPNVPFDFEAYDIGSARVGDKLCMLNLYQRMGWEALKADIGAAAAEGCKAMFIDPITNLTAGMNAGTANERLQEIAVDLAAMALDLNIIIFIFCHLKAPPAPAVPHERGGQVLSSQFAGSRAMMRSCNYMIGIQGNKDPALDEHTRSTRDIIILEDREFGVVGVVKLLWNKLTSLFREIG